LARRSVRVPSSRVPLLALSALLCLFLAACEFRIYADLVIEEDESGTLSVELSMDEELAVLAGGALGGELAIGEDLVPQGWTAEVVTEEGYEGIRASAAFDSLEQLGTRLGELASGTADGEASLTGFLSDMSPIRMEDSFVFRLEMPEDTESLLGEGLAASPIPLDMALLDEVFDIRLSLVLPGEVVTSNADLVTGETMIWNLSLTDSGRVLEAESRLPRSGPPMIIVWGAAALAAVVAVAIVVRIRRGRRPPASDRVAEFGAPPGVDPSGSAG